MAPNVTLHFYANNDLNGSVLYEIDDESPYFRGIRLRPSFSGLGGIEFTLARAVGAELVDADAFEPETLVRVLVHAYSDTLYYPAACFLDKRHLTAIHRDEDGGEVFHFGGPGPKYYLDRSALGIVDHLGSDAHLDKANGVWRWQTNATAGRILNYLLLQDAARPVPGLPDLTNTFDPNDDSDGVPWANTIAGKDDYEIPIGQSYLEALWDLEDLADLFTEIDLGSVATPKFELNAYNALGDDVTGTAFGAGVGLLREGVNIANDALIVEGVSLKKVTHLVVEGKDGTYIVAEKPSWPGLPAYVKWGFLSFPRTSNETILERRGLRWLTHQDNGEQAMTVEILPGASEAAGKYFPSPSSPLWLGNTITIDTSADGTAHTPLDLENRDALVTGLDLILGPAGDTASAESKAQSWQPVKVELNRERGGYQSRPRQGTSGQDPGGGAKGLQLCIGIACSALTASQLEAETATNGDAENAAGTQWSGGGYSTSRKHAGSRSYEATGTSVAIEYAFGAQVFEAGVRYVIDGWRRIQIDHDVTVVRFGLNGGDDESKTYQGVAGSDPPDLWEESDTGADGGTWQRFRICWTPLLESTGVRFRIESTAFSSGWHAVDDLELNSTTAGESDLVGEDSRAARCDHKHTVLDLKAGSTDTALRLAPDGAGGVEWATGGGGAPTTADYLVGTAQAGLSAEIVVGTSPGGELGGTWAAPTVDATHSGSSHADATAAAHPLNTGDPHTQYATNTEFDDHSARHESAGSDAIKLDDLATPDDNTDLNASTTRHGLLRKLSNVSNEYLDGQGNWSSPPGAAVAISYARKGSDQNITSTSFVDVTGLTFTVAANTNYKYRFIVFLLTNVNTEGYNLSVNGPSGTYKMGGILPTAAPNPTGNTANHATGAVADTTGLNTSTGPTAASIAIVEGVALIGASGGTLALRCKTETGGANSVTIQANSHGELVVIP